jgi:hypothetical protein
MKTPALLITENTITIVLNGTTHSIHKDNVCYPEVKKAVREKRWEDIAELINPIVKIKNFTKGKLGFKDGVFTYQGMIINNVLTDKMMNMMKQGFPVDPMVAFLNNLLENPSKTAVEELFGFMAKNDLPITEDGHFLAYKKVRANYLDIHSGTMDNSVGKVLEMPRNAVDDNRNRTCSAGLHFASIAYMPHFGTNDSGSRVVILKINPRDVVSIPSDYNDSKGRACRYEVIDEVNEHGGLDETHKVLKKKAVVKGGKLRKQPKRESNGRFKRKASA